VTTQEKRRKKEEPRAFDMGPFLNRSYRYCVNTDNMPRTTFSTHMGRRGEKKRKKKKGKNKKKKKHNKTPTISP
jgi:hypothetical protein